MTVRAIISVVESRAKPGRFEVSCDARRSKNGYLHPYDARGAGAAAAKAMQYATSVGSRGYAIFAPDSVLAMIPADMRQRA